MGIQDEIERKYLLHGLPEFPESTTRIAIEQGYIDAGNLAAVGTSDLPEPAFPESSAAPLRGRLRRERRPDGQVVCTNTVKRGRGLVRQELEQVISDADFNANWPRTADARLTKTRYRITEGALIWEIDDFHELGIQMAEVELADAETTPPIPDWLRPCIVREVTEDASYRNLMLARRAVESGV